MLKIHSILLLASLLFVSYNGLLCKKTNNEVILNSSIKFNNLQNSDTLCPGSVFTIEWQGVDPGDTVKIEYSTNGGTDWLMITDTATGLSYDWTVPNTPSKNCKAKVTIDVDDIIADTVKICDQVWTTRNLDVTHYRNGDSIPEVTNWNTWNNLTTGAWCYYNNDPVNGEIYGKIYNWYAVNDPRGLAPEGWHVPSDDEWKELEMCLGMSQAEADKSGYNRGTDEGGKLKSTGTIDSNNGLWGNPNTGATNQNHFSALPGGNRIFNGNFSGLIGDTGFWWSSTENLEKFALYRHIEDNRATIGRDLFGKELGLSVRLVRD